MRTPFKATLVITLLMAVLMAIWLRIAERHSGDVMTQVSVMQENQNSLPVSNLSMPEQLLAGGGESTNLERIRARHTGSRPLFLNDQDLSLARAQQVLFVDGVTPQVAAQSPLANDRRLSDNRHWIKYDMRVLAGRAEGDNFFLSMPDYVSVRAEIDNVDLSPGRYRWSGRIFGQEGGAFSITQVFDDNYAIGSITTPMGEYLLEVKNGVGWFVKSDKEFILPADGNDTVSDGDSHPNHKH